LTFLDAGSLIEGKDHIAWSLPVLDILLSYPSPCVSLESDNHSFNGSLILLLFDNNNDRDSRLKEKADGKLEVVLSGFFFYETLLLISVLG
jgi:hypothetical protein